MSRELPSHFLLNQRWWAGDGITGSLAAPQILRVRVGFLLTLLTQPRNLQPMLILPEIVFPAHPDYCSFNGRTSKLNYAATSLADEVFMMCRISCQLIMAVLVAMLHLPQNADLNQHGD